MTKLQEIQQTLKKGIVENPRILWALSSVAFNRCKSANTRMLEAFIATKNAQRPTRAVTNYVGSLQINYAENAAAATELLSSVDNLVSYMRNVTNYAPDYDYTIEQSDDYDVAIKNKTKHDIVTSRSWGNFDSGEVISPILASNTVISAAGPFEIAAPVTYTIDGTAYVVPASSCYIRSKVGPFVFAVNGSLGIKIDDDLTTVDFVAGTYSAAQVVALLEAADITCYAEDNIVTINESQKVVAVAGYGATVLGFPIGVTRTGALYTDCDDIAELLGATVERTRSSVLVDVQNSTCALPDGILVLTSAPYGSYLIRAGQVLPYLVGPLTEYSGTGWLLTERLAISKPNAFSITAVSDPLGLAQNSDGESNVLPDIFQIVAYVGDSLFGYSSEGPVSVKITKVSPGSTITVDSEVGNISNWRLEPTQYVLGKSIQALRSKIQNMVTLLNVTAPQNEVEYQQYLSSVALAEQIYQSIRYTIVSACAANANNSASAIYADLKRNGYDLASNKLAAGEVSSFFLLNDITASSAKMLSVYRSSL
jgi:hypothetical protein